MVHKVAEFYRRKIARATYSLCFLAGGCFKCSFSLTARDIVCRCQLVSASGLSLSWGPDPLLHPFSFSDESAIAIRHQPILPSPKRMKETLLKNKALIPVHPTQSWKNGLPSKEWPAIILRTLSQIKITLRPPAPHLRTVRTQKEVQPMYLPSFFTQTSQCKAFEIQSLRVSSKTKFGTRHTADMGKSWNSQEAFIAI